jgi:hypothetical protein
LSSGLPSQILTGNIDGDDYRGEAMDWKHLLAYITGTVDQELLLRNEYLVTENRILRHQLKGRIRLSDGERKALAVIGQKLGKQALKAVAQIVKPETILAWHRPLVAQKFDGSQQRQSPGRPRIDPELEALIVRIAQENCSWGLTGSSAPWRTSAIRSVTRRWGISSSATVSHRRQSGKRLLRGRSSSARISMS